MVCFNANPSTNQIVTDPNSQWFELVNRTMRSMIGMLGALFEVQRGNNSLDLLNVLGGKNKKGRED